MIKKQILWTEQHRFQVCNINICDVQTLCKRCSWVFVALPYSTKIFYALKKNLSSLFWSDWLWVQWTLQKSRWEAKLMPHVVRVWEKFLQHIGLDWNFKLNNK